jgi:hypothetical protein
MLLLSIRTMIVRRALERKPRPHVGQAILLPASPQQSFLILSFQIR